MQLIFEIKDNTLKRIDTNVLSDDSIKDIVCNFTFIDDEWKNKEKYIIFWDRNNKTTIMSLGRRMKSKCILPEKIAKDPFIIQIYTNDNLYTQKLNAATIFPIKKDDPSKNKCHIKKEINDEYNIKKIFNELFEEINSKVDKIQYRNGYLEYYAKDKLLYSAPLFNDILTDIEEVFKKANFNVDHIILEEDKVICYSNDKILYEIPFSPELSDIAFSGDYNDLKNIPTEFNPIHHNHVVVDVVDYEENIEFDLNTLLDFLGDEISKE